MDYVVNKTEQMAIEADTPQEAVNKVMAGEGVAIAVNYNASPRPKMPVLQPTVIGTRQLQPSVASALAKPGKK